MEKQKERVSLNTYLEMTYFSLTMSFVEESARAFGLEGPDIMKLRLACEEIFVYLTESEQRGKVVFIEAENGIYYTGIKFLFDAGYFDPQAFNLTSSASLSSEKDLKQMGLVIASRSIDSFNMLHNANEGFGIEILKEKTYPGIEKNVHVHMEPAARYNIVAPDVETIKLFVLNTVSHYPDHLFSGDFLYPGKIADMVASGRYQILVASDTEGSPAGGIIWQITTRGMIEVHGPYLFNQPQEFHMAESLVDHLLMAVAKTDAICLVNVFATPELPKGYFEQLGSLDFLQANGEKRTLPFYYRQHREDTGLQVWAHQDLVPFLEETYKNMFFARSIRQTIYGGEKRPPHAVIFSGFNRSQNLVRLRPVWDGADFPEVLEKHVQIFIAEGILNILFQIDLGNAWEADLAPALMEQNFVPKIVLPYGGKGDMVFFQHKGEINTDV